MGIIVQIIGISLIIIGLVLFVEIYQILPETYKQAVAIYEACNIGNNVIQQFGGENLKQFIESIDVTSTTTELNSICNKVNLFKTLVDLGTYVTPLVFLGGIIIILLDIIIKRETNSNDEEITNLRIDSKNIIFCRFCGKSRPVEGEVCIHCRYSNTSYSGNGGRKKCKNCYFIMSNDSIFCGNCGNKL